MINQTDICRDLLALYRAGKFPMGESVDDPRLFVVDPPVRAVIPIGHIHASKSLLRSLIRDGWSATLDTSFDEVVAVCADRAETWINQPLWDFYMEMFSRGDAHSIEIWKGGKLAGCLFGVTQGKVFFAESMASPHTNGSKMAFLWMDWFLKAGSFELCDAQILTPHLARMGAIAIPRRNYLTQLTKAISKLGSPQPAQLPTSLELWQELTQTS